MERFVCSGRGAGRQDDCSFSTLSVEPADCDSAFDHFEQFGHDVDTVESLDYSIELSADRQHGYGVVGAP